MEKHQFITLTSILILVVVTISITIHPRLKDLPEGTHQEVLVSAPLSSIEMSETKKDLDYYDKDFYEEYYEMLEFTTRKNSKVKAYYSPYILGCAGQKEINTLTKDLRPFLEQAGNTSQKQTVYVLSKVTPYPGGLSSVIPSKNKSLLPENLRPYGDPIRKEDWQKFLLNQYLDYPLIILENKRSEHVIYKKHNFLYIPGC
jgi:hypothetical protein